MDRYQTALLQMDSREDREENLRQAERLLAEAAEKGASLAVLPETWDYIGPDMAAHGSDLPGEIGSFLSRQAREKGIYLLGGSVTERAPGRVEAGPAGEARRSEAVRPAGEAGRTEAVRPAGEAGRARAYNTSLLYSPRGELLAVYRKLHLFDVDIPGKAGFRESEEILPGRELVSVDTDLGRIGLSICYDLRFPELYRIAALGGAKLLAVAANFTHATGEAHWELLLRARAVENSCYVLACGQCGQKAAFQSYGNSMVISPWGEVLARAGEEPCCLTAGIDLGEVERVRRELPSLKNRREDLYRLEERRRL